MKEAKATQYRVWVRGWKRDRLVEVKDGKVAMEIARMSCSHCARCSMRINTIRRNINESGLTANWEYREGGIMIVLPLPENTDPIEYLGKVLYLDIS